MTSITGLPFERNTMTMVEIDELSSLKKFWSENHGKKGDLLFPKMGKKEGVEAIDKLVAQTHKFASLNASEKCKDYADAALAIAQTIVTMEQV
jgi:hypothetical protein